MKRFLVIFLCLIICANSAYSFSLFKKKNAKSVEQTEQKSGYEGSLPDITKDFEQQRREAAAKALPKNYNTDMEQDALTKIPINNPKYVEVIMKKNTPSSFILDLRDIINVLEKLKTTIDTQKNTQFFNSQVANLINNVNYFQEKYYGKKEYQELIGHDSLIRICANARELAILNTRQQLFKQYIPSEEYAYSPQNITAQLNDLSKDIGDIIILLKNADK